MATIGSCCCYWLSWLLAHQFIEICFPSLLATFRHKIKGHSQHLIYHLLFLRISPLLPNWFINLASPHLHVPFTTFIIVTIIGLMPANYIHINTGIQLDALVAQGIDNDKIGGGWYESCVRIIGLLCLASLALIPTLFNKKLEKVIPIPIDDIHIQQQEREEREE